MLNPLNPHHSTLPKNLLPPPFYLSVNNLLIFNNLQIPILKMRGYAVNLNYELHPKSFLSNFWGAVHNRRSLLFENVL